MKLVTRHSSLAGGGTDRYRNPGNSLFLGVCGGGGGGVARENVGAMGRTF